MMKKFAKILAVGTMVFGLTFTAGCSGTSPKSEAPETETSEELDGANDEYTENAGDDEVADEEFEIGDHINGGTVVGVDDSGEAVIAKDPEYEIIECPIRLADTDGYTLKRNSDKEWELSADQDVLIWMDLPNNAGDDLRLEVESIFKYEVKAGKTSSIEVIADDNDSEVRYTGTIKFRAKDDLTIGALIEHGRSLRSSEFTIHNSSTRMFSWMEEARHAYIYYGIYTSCRDKYGVSEVKGKDINANCSASYTITPDGAPKMPTWTDESAADKRPNKSNSKAKEKAFRIRKLSKKLALIRNRQHRLRR